MAHAPPATPSAIQTTHASDERAISPELRATIAKMEFDATHSISAVLEDIRVNAMQAGIHKDIDSATESMYEDASSVRAVLAAIDRIHHNTTKLAWSVIYSSQHAGIGSLKGIASAMDGKSTDALDNHAEGRAPGTPSIPDIQFIPAPQSDHDIEPRSETLVLKVVNHVDKATQPVTVDLKSCLYFEIKKTTPLAKVMDLWCQNCWQGKDRLGIRFWWRRPGRYLALYSTLENVFDEEASVRYLSHSLPVFFLY